MVGRLEATDHNIAAAQCGARGAFKSKIYESFAQDACRLQANGCITRNPQLVGRPEFQLHLDWMIPKLWFDLYRSDPPDVNSIDAYRGVFAKSIPIGKQHCDVQPVLPMEATKYKDAQQSNPDNQD